MNKMQRSFLGSLGKKVNQATQERAVVLQKPVAAPKKIEEAEIVKYIEVATIPSLVGPMVEIAVEVVAEPVVEVVAEPVAEVVAEVVAEPAAEVVAEPVVEVVAEPVVEVVADVLA